MDLSVGRVSKCNPGESQITLTTSSKNWPFQDWFGQLRTMIILFALYLFLVEKESAKKRGWCANVGGVPSWVCGSSFFWRGSKFLKRGQIFFGVGQFFFFFFFGVGQYFFQNFP